jgi:tetratricopeptide (TPR) repeat protein
MSITQTVLVLGLSVAVAVADDSRTETQPAASLATARDQFLRGDYDAAIAGYDQLAREPETAVAAAVGRAEVDLLQGTYAEGISRLQAVEDVGGADADWHAALAALLVQVGRYDEAVKHNRQALDVSANHARARWQLGSLYEYLGREQEAVKTYGPFEEVMTEGALPDKPEELICLGSGFHRLSVLKRHPNSVQRTKHVLREVFQEAFDVIDPAYWPGRLVAANLLLEKHNLMEARTDFEAVCGQNPRAPGAHVGLGRIALDAWNFEAAEMAGETALEINPNDPSALLLLADIRMQEGRCGDAALIAHRALETNPNSIEALAVLAAAQLRMGDAGASQLTQERVRKLNPRPAVLHYVIGEWLGAARQFTEAKPHLEKAIEFAPTWPTPRVELGQLYLEIGEEDLARKTLDEAFAMDSFDPRTHDILNLLDRLDKFARKETEHFIIRYDEAADGVLAPYFAEQAEAMYPGVCDRAGGPPAQRTMIEIFPDHMGFSMRIGGRPFISTIGACSGRVIAMCAPRRQIAPFGNYNWAEVVRHEFAHTVSMAATENRISRWFTEALAQQEETNTLSWGKMHMLAETVGRDQLYAVDDLDWGFIKPDRPGGQGLAYTQAEWMLAYIAERYGERSIHEMLNAVREGKTQQQMFREVLKQETTEFDQEFKAWAAKQVERWGLPISADRVDEIEAQLKDKPDDAMLLARLARARLQAGDLGGAKKAARQALDLDEDQPIALEVISRALIQRMLEEPNNDKRRELIDRTEPYLRRLSGLAPDNPAAIKYLGYVEQARRNWPKAVEHLTRYQTRFPADPDPYRRLVAVYLEQDRIDDALKEQTALAGLVPHEAPVPRRLADLYAGEKRFGEAAVWYYKALQIDPYHRRTHRSLAEACLELGDYAGAEREYEAIRLLKPDSPEGYDGLAQTCRATGRLDKAEEYASKSAEVRCRQTMDPVSTSQKSEEDE